MRLVDADAMLKANDIAYQMALSLVLEGSPSAKSGSELHDRLNRMLTTTPTAFDYDGTINRLQMLKLSSLMWVDAQKTDDDAAKQVLKELVKTFLDKSIDIVRGGLADVYQEV